MLLKEIMIASLLISLFQEPTCLWYFLKPFILNTLLKTWTIYWLSEKNFWGSNPSEPIWTRCTQLPTPSVSSDQMGHVKVVSYQPIGMAGMQNVILDVSNPPFPNTTFSSTPEWQSCDHGWRLSSTFEVYGALLSRASSKNPLLLTLQWAHV